MATSNASNGAPATPRPRPLIARLRHRALAAGALLAVLTLTTACTGTASAHPLGQQDATQGGQDDGNTIVCPDVAPLLTDVPAAAQADVDRELAALEYQIAEANTRLAGSAGESGPNVAQNAVLEPLAGKRTAVLGRVRTAIERAGGGAPGGLADLSECALGDAAEGEDGGINDSDDSENNGGDNGGLDEDEQRLLGLVPGIEFAGDIVNGNRTLGQDCSVSDLDRHDGFESDEAVCVEVAAGEQAAFDQGPQLLIVDFPQQVDAGEPFTYTVSTRNLVRARFLGAAEGGYYAESSFLDNEGLQLGHFHTGCRMLSDGLDAAPRPEVLPDFFQAVEDFGGGAAPDFVEIEVADGLPQSGLAQCGAWAGDPSHRVPMMARAQQFPAFDTFLLQVQ